MQLATFGFSASVAALVIGAIATSILVVNHLRSQSKSAAPRHRDECPSGGRHNVRLAQEHLGRGQVAYRSRCSKCGREVGFGFEQLERR